MRMEMTINGKKMSIDAHPGERVSDLLRRRGLLGVKEGCGEGDCGTCVVLVDGRAVNSCLMIAATLDGREVTTIEGLGSISEPHPLQEAYAREGAVQCGYCTPGSILAAAELLGRRPDPTEEEIKTALDGNLCRCTGYLKKIRSVQAAARMIRERGSRDE